MSHSPPASRVVRTRFAPSPTGFLHIGGARTALFSWAYARHFQGVFILRVEDTDLERSTPEATQAILDAMQWLALQPDEGPFFQTQRFPRYREVIRQMLAAGTAYHCYCSPAELEVMREEQRVRGAKPRYDGRWRPENARGKAPPPDIKPVVRFRNPDDGAVVWNDLIKGPISIANAELDDLIIARSDGTPTYNFCVVVDDWDMAITHVIRGDDHVNNTPRQINILKALGATLPEYGHVPMIHGPDGQKLSKRHGAVSVMQYEADGFLPEAIVNYLARLGWSHGDDEIFTREQLVHWFDGEHLARSPAQFDIEKLRWLNNQYLKSMDNQALAALVLRRLQSGGLSAQAGTIDLPAICGLFKDRSPTLVDLADAAAMFLAPPTPKQEDVTTHLMPAALETLRSLADALAQTEWTRETIAATVKKVVAERGMKMPQVAIPARVAVFGRAQTPALEAVLALLPKEETLARLRSAGVR